MNIQSLKRFLKETFVIGLVLSVIVFAWIRLIFFEVPFSISEDGPIFLKTILCGWIMIMLAKTGWLLLLLAGQKIESATSKKSA
jgi:hypothetical protein